MTNEHDNDISRYPSNEEMDERIVRFMRCQMDDVEDAEFRTDLRSNQALRERAVVLARLVAGMEELRKDVDAAVIDELMAMSRDDVARMVSSRDGATVAADAAGQTTVVPMRRRLVVIWAASVAIALMLVPAWQWYSRRMSERENLALAAEYVSQIPYYEDYTRGASVDSLVATELSSLFGVVVSGASDTLPPLDDVNSRLARLFEQAAWDADSPYADYVMPIGWHLAIGYLKAGDRRMAIAVLDRLMELEPDEHRAVHIKARELKDKLQ